MPKSVIPSPGLPSPWEKQALPLFPPYLAGLALLGIGAWGGARVYIDHCDPEKIASWILFAAALLFPVLAFAAHRMAKGTRRSLYILSYCLNALGSGCAVSAYYAKIGILPAPEAAVPAAILGSALCIGLVWRCERWRKLWLLFCLLFALALLVLTIYIWIRQDRIMGSFAFFTLTHFLWFLLSCAAVCIVQPQTCRPFQTLSYVGYGVFALIALIVALILSDGELLDGLDFPEIDLRRQRKNSKR